MSIAMENNGPDWGLPENFVLSDADFDGENFSKLLIAVISRLDGAFPNRVDLSTCKRIARKREEFEQLLNWLGSQGIVNGDVTNCALTLSGRQAYKAALNEFPILAVKLSRSSEGLEMIDASRMLLAVLRVHYLEFVQRLPQSETK